MRDSTSRSASAGASHDQGIELQNLDKSKGKGPDPELYTASQLSQLKVLRRDRSDVASETFDRRVLNTPQHQNLPGSQRSGMDNVDSVSNAGATPSTLDTHQRVEIPHNQNPHGQPDGSQLPDDQLPVDQLRGGELGGGQLPSNPPPSSQLHSSPPPSSQLRGSQLSAVDNIDSASKVNAIGSTLNAHPGVEFPRTQLPDIQPHGGHLVAVDNINSASRTNTMGIPLKSPQRAAVPRTQFLRSLLPDTEPQGGHLTAVENINSASRTNTMGIPLKSPQRTAVPRTQLPRTQLRHGQLPSNQALESRPSVVDNVDHTSTMKSIVRKRREFYNTKAGDSGNVVQPKKFHPAELHPDSRKDVEGTYPYTKAASSQLVVDPGLPQNSGTQLQPNTCHPAEAQPDSGKNLRGTSSSTNAASAQPGSDLNKGHSASSSTNSLIVKPLNIIKKRYPPQSAANPPQGRLPSLPSQRPSLYSNAEESSLASTYGDTASLLNLSVQGEVNVDESGASRNILTSEPVNGRASIAGTGDVKTRIQSSNALFTPPNEIRFRPTSTFDTSNRSSGRISFIHSNGSVHSRPLSVQEAGVLERQIQAAVGRMGRTSGESSRFSILTFHEEARSGSGYDDQISNSSGELILDLGPGGSQSTSSHGPLSLSATVHSDEEDVAVFSKYRSSHGSSEAATAAMMWADLCDEEAATSPLDGINAIESRGRGRIIGEMDDEGGVMINPETVEENRRIPRQTHLYTLARLTGSSVAGFSGSAEGSEDEGTERTPSSQHGDRRRYTRPSRLERDGQSGHLILRPEYTFTGGAGFPHRDALTPSQANLFSNSSYQHPTPLSTDHVHPFRSSPPLINRAGASQHSYADSQTSDGSLPMDDDENYVLKPNTYSGQDTLHRADTYFNSDRTLRADTYSSPDLYLHPNTYSRPEQYSRDTYSRQGCGVYQSEVDENLASGSRSNGDRTRYHQREANCVSSAEANALEEFYENKEFQNFINRNGSEANMMGRQSKPKVTRTPMRTGMHDNTNFLAAYDHSYTPFHTNRYELYLNLENLDQQQSLAPHTHHTSSHRRVGANRPQLYQPYRETSWNFSSPREYGFTHDLLREHRRVLAAANLLPRAFTPPTPNHHLTPLHLASLDFSSTASGGSSIRAVGPAGPSSGPTSLPPRCGGAQPMERRRFVPAPHLIPNRRPSAAVLNRQRNLGAAIIAVMGVCPPLLLIVGLGGMDATLASAMRGEVAGFTEAQKKVALGLGVGGTLGVLLGAIGAIIYLVLHH